MESKFPKMYDIIMWPLEKTRFKKIRTKLVCSAKGEVLEIGSGTGANFPYYQHATKVTAIEPNTSMIKQGKKRLKQANVPIDVIEAGAESLPFADDTFDTIISTLVFCSIPNPIKALEEVCRVGKNGAKLIFFEHVRMKQPLFGKFQDMLNPFWKKRADGCHLNRDTLATIIAAGIEVDNVESLYGGLFLSIHCTNQK